MRLNVLMITSAALVDKLLSRNVLTVFDFLQRPNLDLQDICNLSCKVVLLRDSDRVLAKMFVLTENYIIFTIKVIRVTGVQIHSAFFEIVHKRMNVSSIHNAISLYVFNKLLCL